jgi:hypothetical protein
MSVSACVCAPSTFLSGGSCVSRCPVGMYGDEGTHTCIQCPGTQVSDIGTVGVTGCRCPDETGGLNGSGVCTPCTGGQISTVTNLTCPDSTWTLNGSVCSKVSDYDCAGVSYDDIIEAGQLLEPSQIDIGTSTRTFTNQPVGQIGTNSFTISFDLQIEKDTPGTTNWFSVPSRNILRENLTNIGLNTYNGRTIGFDYYQYGILSSQFTLGVWFNCVITFDVSIKKIVMYINGIKQGESDFPTLFTPSPGTPSFVWRSTNSNNDGYINVKNVYWWNKALSVNEIGLLNGLSVPGACYKTGNTCYSTTYTCPKTSCSLKSYVCPSEYILNGSVCLKSGQPMIAAGVICSCPTTQYTCPSNYTLVSGTSNCRPNTGSYLSCASMGPSRNTTAGRTTLISSNVLVGNQCIRYTCNADTSQSGSYLELYRSTCTFYSTSYSCPAGYSIAPDTESFMRDEMLLPCMYTGPSFTQAYPPNAGPYLNGWVKYTNVGSTYTPKYFLPQNPYSLNIPTTEASNVRAQTVYNDIPATPVYENKSSSSNVLTRTEAQVMAVQTTAATTSQVTGRQCICIGNQYWDLQNKQCTSICAAATYGDSASKTCQPCPANMTSRPGSTSSSNCVCSYASPYWSGFSCMQQLNPKEVLKCTNCTTRYEDNYTIHEFNQYCERLKYVALSRATDIYLINII